MKVKYNEKTTDQITGTSPAVIDSSEVAQAQQAEIIQPVRVYRPANNAFTPYISTASKIEFKPRQFWTEAPDNNRIIKNMESIPHRFQYGQLNWTLFIGAIAVALLIFLKTYYEKFVNQVFATLLNFHLAEKMLREKNIILRRAFLLMNINFVLIFSLFILLLARFFEISFTSHYFYDYLLILLIVVGILLVRLLILYLAASLFNSMRAMIEHIHISYLVNKNLGLILLPLVFSAIYVTGTLSKILLISGMVLFLVATIYKLIRSFQIIIKNGVLLYYAILYLCTLELLPLLIGIKILIN
jgi:hypothetical protein